jgi:hypothetical protein
VASGSPTTATGGQTGGAGGQTSGSGGLTSGGGGKTASGGGGSGASGGGIGASGGVSGGTTSSDAGLGGGGANGSGAAGNGAAGSGTSRGSGGSSGTGGISGTGITINGKFVPKEKAVVFLHIGHSNMRGQASLPTSLRPYFYNTEDGLWSYRGGSYTLAKEPTAPEGTMTYAGPGMAILHSARGAAAPGSDVQFISIGYGVGSKTSVDYQKTGVYYPIFMGWAGALKGKVTFGALVVMLGITERHLAVDQIPGFPSRMAQIIADIRADLGEPNLPVLFCDYEMTATGDLAPTGAVGKVILPLVRQLPGLVSNLVLVPTDKLPLEDDHHFNLQGHKDWAARLIALMQSNGWFPW